MTIVDPIAVAAVIKASTRMTEGPYHTRNSTKADAKDTKTTTEKIRGGSAATIDVMMTTGGIRTSKEVHHVAADMETIWISSAETVIEATNVTTITEGTTSARPKVTGPVRETRRDTGPRIRDPTHTAPKIQDPTHTAPRIQDPRRHIISSPAATNPNSGARRIPAEVLVIISHAI